MIGMRTQTSSTPSLRDASTAFDFRIRLLMITIDPSVLRSSGGELCPHGARLDEAHQVTHQLDFLTLLVCFGHYTGVPAMSWLYTKLSRDWGRTWMWHPASQITDNLRELTKVSG